MSTDAITTVVLDALKRIAPEMAPAAIDPRAPLREQLDLDSMDFLNLVLALHGRLGIDIPEADYPKLATLERAVAYLASRIPPGVTP
jgi:acyl carrier protein